MGRRRRLGAPAVSAARFKTASAEETQALGRRATSYAKSAAPNSAARKGRLLSLG